ncbi:MAG: excinuclease ABC subunit UvrC [Anaerolineae bacterium]|nr:excinuclease ABC subunit UvrC [Anaerolineae bacterium]
MRPQLQDKLDSVPDKPGVYIYRDRAEKVIYVGKSIHLQDRVRSYFHASSQRDHKTRELVANIYDLDFIVTDTELEALILECELIKKHRPRYNIRLKDDKHYPYIKITWAEDFPRIFASRRMEQDGSRYYGPYASSSAVHHTLDLLRKLFPYRTCNREITGKDRRPCLYYHIGRCLGPCIGAVSREDYRAVIAQVSQFLEGRDQEIVDDLESRMRAASAALDFERAAVYRDQIRDIQQITRQKIVSAIRKDQDVVAFARDDGHACVQVFFIRNGTIIGREYFVLEGATGEEDASVLQAFVEQFYNEAAYVPPEILLPYNVEQARIIESWLRGKRGGTVTLRVPKRGKSKELLRLAADNAAQTLSSLRAQWEADQTRQTQALAQIQEALELPSPPARIEGYDISTFHGAATYASMVVFVHGVPRKSEYRRFRIRTVTGHADDYASLQEALRRRFKRTISDPDKESVGIVADPSFAVLPDLVLIDGGKGQLSAALEVLSEYGLDHLPVFGLAKREEEVYLPRQQDPVCLPRDSEGLHLIQRIRDEAHRFAITAHRRARRRLGLASTLEAIPGVGPQRRKALLKAFGSMERIRKASIEELAAVPGMTHQVAERIKESL